MTVSACVWGLETQLPTVSVGGSRELVGSGVTEAGEGPEWPYIPGHPRKAPSLSKELTWANLQAFSCTEGCHLWSPWLHPGRFLRPPVSAQPW